MGSFIRYPPLDPELLASDSTYWGEHADEDLAAREIATAERHWATIMEMHDVYRHAA